jgi:hypothetical protein
MTTYFNRQTGEAIVCGQGFDHVVKEMLAKLPPERAAQFERLNLGNVVHFRSVVLRTQNGFQDPHLSVTSVPDGTI